MTHPTPCCYFPDCPRPPRARGFCIGHLQQQRRGKEMTPLRTLPTYAWTYIVYWPDAIAPGVGVLKVGRSWTKKRLWHLVQSGAEIICNTGNTDGSWEREALLELDRLFDPAFDSAADAAHLLPTGGGWTECVVVEERDLQMAFDACIRGFSRGTERSYNDPSAYAGYGRARRSASAPTESTKHDSEATWADPDDHDGASAAPELPERAPRRADDRACAVVGRRRRRPAADRPAGARSSAVPTGRSFRRPRPDRDAPAHSRGGGLLADVRTGRVGVARADASTTRCTPETARRLPRILGGEFSSYRGSAGARARGGAGARACARGACRSRPGVRGCPCAGGSNSSATASPPCLVGCSASGVPGSSSGVIPELRAVWHRQAAVRPIHRHATVRRQAGGLGVLAWKRR